MKDDFEAQVNKIIINTQRKLEAVVKDAIQKTIDQAQLPGPSKKNPSGGKGGKMRIDTGFLRSSGVAAIGSMPSGPTRGDKDQTYTWDGDSIGLVLSKLKLGETFYFGWTANYAKYREAYDAFLETALQNWQANVNASIAEMQKRFRT